MAIQTTVAIAQKLVRMLETGLHLLTSRIKLPVVAQDDSQVIFTMPSAGRMIAAFVTVPNSLGAGTAKLQKRDVDTGVAIDISASTTAATAGTVIGTGLLPIDFKQGDTIELLFSGAAVTAQTTSNVIVDVSVQHA
jgi:hypothetical protein